MIDLTKLLAERQIDCAIDPNHLDESSRTTPMLHAKYLTHLAESKLALKQTEFKQKQLLKDKWLYYSGKMCQDDIETRNWKPDPFDGLKILKSDYEYYYESDPELIESEAKIQYLKTTIDTLKEIVDNLKWRHQTLGNMIRWRQFESGM